MAYQDALFQLGMDLTRSSTAQKEDHDEAPRPSRDVVSKSELRPLGQGEEVGRFQDRMGSGIAGSHLVIDLFGARRLDDADHIEKTLRRCAEVAGVSVEHVHFNAVAPDNGVSGFAAMSGGHSSIHTHPLTGSAVLDIYVRGDIKAPRVVDVLQDAFNAVRVVVRRHKRGNEQKALTQASSEMRAAPRSRARVRKAA